MTNASTSTNAPTATFTLGERSYSIEFGLSHLLKIEDASGVPLMQLAQEQLERLAVRDENGDPVAKPSPEQTSKAFMRIPIGKQRELVAACIPMPVDQVPLQGLSKAYMQLATCLSQAVGQLTGVRDEDDEVVEQRPTEASAS